MNRKLKSAVSFAIMLWISAMLIPAAAEEPHSAPVAAAAPVLSPSDALAIRTAQLAAERAQIVAMANQQKLQDLVRKLAPPGYQIVEDPQTGDLKLIAAAEPPAGAPTSPKPAAKVAGPAATK